MSESRHDLHISRRALLKVIAAAGGSLAASTMLPGKWVKPAMRVGVLPVHAQTSSPAAPTYQIVDTTYSWGDFCLGNLTATISPVADGVQMECVVCPVNGSTPACQTLTASTVGGVATFPEPSNPRCFQVPITVTFRFANAAQCSTNCSVTYTLSLI